MKQDITLEQYEIIYRIVASIGMHFAHGSGYSCQFYNVFGAFIIEELLKVKAHPVMGAAFIRLNEAGDTVSFAGEEEGNFYSSPDAFHCWIETPNFIIDLAAPEYRESASKNRAASTIPRQMFQKNKKLMSPDPYSMRNPGDFFFSENRQLTAHLLGEILSRKDSQDFAKICCDWYTKYSNERTQEYSVITDSGEIKTIKLIASNLTNKW